MPGIPVSISSDVLPEIREFERASTTTLNAALQPVVGHYLERLENSLRQAGCEGQILIGDKDVTHLSAAERDSLAAHLHQVRDALVPADDE